MCFMNSNCSCYNRCNSCNNSTPNVIIRNIGIHGPQGPAGNAFNQNATIYSNVEQNITSGTPITFGSTLTNNNMTVSTTGITVPATGTYLVSYGTNTIGDDGTANNVSIAVNGNIQSATTRALATNLTPSGSYILNLNAGDVITLIPSFSASTTLSNSNSTSAFLTVNRIA